MKIILAYIIPVLSLFFVGCNATVPSDTPQQEASIKKNNPCKDELYLRLKAKNIDSLSEREFQYFIQKEKECAEFTKSVYETAPSKQIADQYSSNSNTIFSIVIFSLLASGLIYWLISINGK